MQILKSYRSKDELYPYLKVTINEDEFTLSLQCTHTRPAGMTVSRPWCFHSHCAHIKQLDRICCPQLIHGGAFNTSLSIDQPYNHWFLLSQPHKDALTPGSPPILMQSYTKNYNALVYNINQARQSFSQQGFVPNCSMTASLIATDDVYTPPVSPKHFPLRQVLCYSYNYLLIIRQRSGYDQRRCYAPATHRKNHHITPQLLPKL